MSRVACLAILTMAGMAATPAFPHCGHHNDCDGSGDGCCHPMMQRSRGANAGVRAAEQSLAGKVVEVIYLPGASEDTGMVEARLMAGTQAVTARLGPSGFLHQNQMDIREGDTITVTGYRVAAGGRETVVATEMVKDGKTIRLRDAWGRSAW